MHDIKKILKSLREIGCTHNTISNDVIKKSHLIHINYSYGVFESDFWFMRHSHKPIFVDDKIDSGDYYTTEEFIKHLKYTNRENKINKLKELVYE